MELHTRRAHYADKDPHGGTPKWQSRSRNPAALSVSVEARAAALERYTVALPLFTLPSRAQQTSERPGDLLQHGDRVLYLDLEHDTVVLLGDLAYTRLTALLAWFRRMDKPVRGRRGGGGVGLRRLAISVGVAGMALPFGLGCAISWGLYHEFRDEPGLVPISFGTYMLFVGQSIVEV